MSNFLAAVPFVSLSQKPIIWFPELLFKFFSSFNMVLELSELTVNLASELSDWNYWQSELWFDCIVYN